MDGHVLAIWGTPADPVHTVAKAAAVWLVIGHDDAPDAPAAARIERACLHDGSIPHSRLHPNLPDAVRRATWALARRAMDGPPLTFAPPHAAGPERDILRTVFSVLARPEDHWAADDPPPRVRDLIDPGDTLGETIAAAQQALADRRRSGILPR